MSSAIFARQRGHSDKFNEQTLQQMTCPQGKNTRVAYSNVQIKHFCVSLAASNDRKRDFT